MFLENQWYVAAWDRELSNEPLARTFLGQPVVLFRDETGQPVALEDRCPHRRAPLSMGRLLPGEGLQCRYHGAVFNSAGLCTRIPSQKEIPAKMRCRVYPLVERHSWVWIFMGDPDLADERRIPDFHWLDSREWGAKGDLFHVKANWQLIVDNLLDLTHLATVHETTIGNAAIAEKADTRLNPTEDGLLVTRWVMDAAAPPTYVKAGGFSGNIDRWQYIDFKPPAFLRLHVGGASTGGRRPDGSPPADGLHMRNLNAITPETENTTHYFWAQAQNFDPLNARATDLVFEQVKSAFLEDVAIFEAQQRVIDSDNGPPEVDLAADAAQIQARRILERLREAEAVRARKAS